MEQVAEIQKFQRFSTTGPSETTRPPNNRCGFETCDGWWRLQEGRARPCMICRRHRLTEVVPERFSIPLTELQPTELIASTVSLKRQARVLDLIRADPCANLLLMGRSGCGKTQLLHSLYLDAVERSEYGEIFVISETREIVSDLRDSEINESRSRPPILSAHRIKEWHRSGKRVSIFLDEFHKAGIHTDWTIGVLHDLVDAIYQVRDSGRLRFCATTNLLSDEFIAQLGGSLYRRLEDICTVIEFDS